MAGKTGWEPYRRTHFDEIVESYDSIRPSYPARMLADVFAYAGPSGGKTALEIGAGTGKATIPFLDAGYAVTAVEPGEHMAAFLREKTRGYDGLQIIGAAFEDAELREGYYDLVYAASSFHWVNADAGCPKLYRILRPGGAVALLRYNVNPCDNTALYDEIDALYDRYYRVHYEGSKRPAVLTHEQRRAPSEIKRGYGFSDLRDYGFCDVEMRFYDTVISYGARDYTDSLETLSDHRLLPERDKSALYTGIRAAIERHGGRYDENYVFQLYLGRRQA